MLLNKGLRAPCSLSDSQPLNRRKRHARRQPRGADTARHRLEDPEFYDQGKALAEMERVFDICHGCRRCVSLCQSFPTLFDLVDATADGEVHEVKKEAYWSVVDQCYLCYLCDLCFMTKCPYTPPHPWQLDFPHLMLRAPRPSSTRTGMCLPRKSSWPARMCMASLPAFRSLWMSSMP